MDKIKSMSVKGAKLLMNWEGVSSVPYKDSGGAWTIGSGHLLTKAERLSGKIVISGAQVKYTNGLSVYQIRDLLEQDLVYPEHVVSSSVEAQLNSNQFDSLVSFVFNVGSEAFLASTLLRNLNAGLYDRVPAQMRRWIYDNGVKVDGLKNRRENEIRLWNGEI